MSSKEKERKKKTKTKRILVDNEEKEAKKERTAGGNGWLGSARLRAEHVRNVFDSNDSRWLCHGADKPCPRLCGK